MMYKAFGDECMGITQITEWYKLFKNGRAFVDCEPRFGGPSTITTPNNIENVWLAIDYARSRE